MGRGGGKTALAAALASEHFLERLGGGSTAEVVLVAGSHSQARIAFGDILGILRDELGELDRRTWSVNDTVNVARVEHRRTRSTIRCIGSDPRLAHGLRPSLLLLDEPAQWGEARSDLMVAALRTGLGKRPGSRLVALGTRPAAAASGHWFARMLEDPAPGCYAQTHAARPGDPPYQRRTWRRANPSLDAMPDLLAAYRREAAAARRDPMAAASFAALRLNSGVSEAPEAVLLPADVWGEALERPEAEASGPYFLGLDPGTSASMTAAAAWWPETGRLDAFAVWPERPTLVERDAADAAGGRYVAMHHRGELLLAGDRVADLRALLAETLRRWGAPAGLAADRWRQAELVQELEAMGYPQCPASWRGQGFRDGGEDVRATVAAFHGGRVRPTDSLLLASAVSEARLSTDPAGNRKLDRRAKRSTGRDDAASAMVLAVGLGVRVTPPPGAAPRRLVLGSVG